MSSSVVSISVPSYRANADITYIVLFCSGVDVYTAVAGAVGALYGPLHGGANEAVLRMLERIGSVENIPGFIAGTCGSVHLHASHYAMCGFGHASQSAEVSIEF